MASLFNILPTTGLPNDSQPDGSHPLRPVPGQGRARPPWLRVRFGGGPNYQDLTKIIRTLDLHTVCESARCPNIGECWEHRTATFMILGNICTRACGFCAVPSGN